MSQLRPPDELARGDFEMVVRRLADDLAFGVDASRFVGSGIEYAKSRPYAAGDPMKMMDWRITARLGRPFVKEYETPKRTALHLVVDTSASMGIASTRLTKHDLAVWIAGALGLLGLRRMSPVAIVGAGERATRGVASLARGDLFRSLDPLRTAAVDEGTRLGDRVRELVVRAERTSVVVVLSDLHDDDAVPALRSAAKKHDVVAIHLVDPIERDPVRAGFLRFRDAESAEAGWAHGGTVWRRPGDVATDLAKSGVSYLRLDTDRPFLAPLRQFLAFRPDVRGGRG
jgi:uncharacterized protein (DUF58 family)